MVWCAWVSCRPLREGNSSFVTAFPNHSLVLSMLVKRFLKSFFWDSSERLLTCYITWPLKFLHDCLRVRNELHFCRFSSLTCCVLWLLSASGVPVYKSTQEAGSFIVTFPKAFHCGFSYGVSIYFFLISFIGFWVIVVYFVSSTVLKRSTLQLPTGLRLEVFF